MAGPYRRAPGLSGGCQPDDPVEGGDEPFERGRQLLALGVSSRQRADVLPNVIPLAEQGIANYDVSLWFGMWAPTGTPPAVVQKLNAEVARVLQIAPVKEQFRKLGIDPLPMKQDEFAQFVRKEMATYQRIVKQAGIQPH